MFIKEEKGSTLLLKLFAILFGIFIVFGYVLVHTVDTTGKMLFQKTEAICNVNNVGYCFSMEILYMVALLVIAALGFLSVTLITMEWGIRRESETLSAQAKATSMPDFYRNCVCFLNCIKIAMAVIFCTMFFKYSNATLIIPMAVSASLFLDSFVWNKRCREMNANHQSLLLDVALEFMNVFTPKKNRKANQVKHRQSFIFYACATFFIMFCIAAIATKLNTAPVAETPAQVSTPINAVIDPVNMAENEALLQKQAAKARAKAAAQAAKKRRAARKKAEAAQAAEPAKVSVAPPPSSTPVDDDDEDWW